MIVRSLLETDLYKFTMWQAFLHSHPGAHAEYKFVSRKSSFPLGVLADDINNQLDSLCNLRFKEDELKYLSSLRFIKPDFIDFLRLFQFNRNYIQVNVPDSGDLEIVAKGPLVHVMGFEIYVLYIISELYYQAIGNIASQERDMRERLQNKIDYVNNHARRNPDYPFIFFDFGLRRRFSGTWQYEVVKTLKDGLPIQFRGTSNCWMAREFDLVPIGTMAHEYVQAYQGFDCQLRNHQRAAFEAWVQEYRGDLGIALTDTIGIDAFMRDFDLYFAKLFDGVRHDSGDPIEWGEKILRHYESLKINPKTKRLIFSDGLDFPQAIEIYNHFFGQAQTAFGIGTNLMSDSSADPLSIVMKMVMCNGHPVAKLSDTSGKTLCEDPSFLEYLRTVFNKKESK